MVAESTHLSSSREMLPNICAVKLFRKREEELTGETEEERRTTMWI